MCYLQWEKAKQHQEREESEALEENEEWKTLQDAARSYLTNAKKVIFLGKKSATSFSLFNFNKLISQCFVT